MARYVLLDAGPLGLAAKAGGKPLVDRFHLWLAAHRASGDLLVVPAISDYEVRRELLRIRSTAGLRRLDELRGEFDFRPITPESLDKAAEFWATLRQVGLPTAGNEDLDGDAILAGLAVTIGLPTDRVLVATTNTRHLARFPGVVVIDWAKIT